MILCISGKLVATAMDFLNYMLEALVCDYFPFQEQGKQVFYSDTVDIIYLSGQVIEWLWLDNVYEMCGGSPSYFQSKI